MRKDNGGWVHTRFRPPTVAESRERVSSIRRLLKRVLNSLEVVKDRTPADVNKF